MKLLVRGKLVTVSTDRVKPAYILNEADCRNTPSNGYPASTVPPLPLQTTRYTLPSPRPLPRVLQHLSKHLRGGGGG
jgi:hypothetical protein